MSEGDIRHALIYVRTHGVSAAPQLFERYARDVAGEVVFLRAELVKVRAQLADAEAVIRAQEAAKTTGGLHPGFTEKWTGVDVPPPDSAHDEAMPSLGRAAVPLAQEP